MPKTKKKSAPKKAKNTKKRSKKIFRWIFLLLLSLIFGGLFYIKERYPAYFQKLINKITIKKVNISYENDRIERIASWHQNKLMGIDLSHYQEKDAINWDSLHLHKPSVKFSFAIFRATMGNDATDKNFLFFWEKAKEKGLIRGAYHYYRPDENPILQAESYLKNVKLEKGDFLPILDIEQLPKNKNMNDFLTDIQVWLNLVEKKYKKKPIIYSYSSFYSDFLANKFKNYPLWIANYNNVLNPLPFFEWKIWQFTENGITPGANVKIDFNIFNGNRSQISEILIP